MVNDRTIVSYSLFNIGSVPIYNREFPVNGSTPRALLSSQSYPTLCLAMPRVCCDRLRRSNTGRRHSCEAAATVEKFPVSNALTMRCPFAAYWKPAPAPRLSVPRNHTEETTRRHYDREPPHTQLLSYTISSPRNQEYSARSCGSPWSLHDSHQAEVLIPR